MPRNPERRPWQGAPNIGIGDPSTKQSLTEEQYTRQALAQLIRTIDLQEVLMACAIADAVRQATAEYWDRRAEEMSWVGNERCDLIALACRRKAWLIRQSEGEPYEGYAEDMAAVLAERRVA